MIVSLFFGFVPNAHSQANDESSMICVVAAEPDVQGDRAKDGFAKDE